MQDDDRWRIDESSNGIVWHVAEDTRLPHSDHVEMSGRKVSVIVHYGMDEDRRLTLTRDIIWPTLRTKEGDVRGYTRRTYGDEVMPQITVDGLPWQPGPVRSILFNSVLRIEHEPVDGIWLFRQVFPSMDKGCVIEQWVLFSPSEDVRQRGVVFTPLHRTERTNGVYGTYQITLRTDDAESDPLHNSELGVLPFLLVFEAHCKETPSAAVAEPYTPLRDRPADTGGMPPTELFNRLDRRDRIRGEGTLWLNTPDPVLNHLFAFAKFRAAECLFETAKMGLVHSPTGGSYYGGVWANDQAEYSGPLFAYLGDTDADQAALNAYRVFARAMEARPDYSPIPSSFEMEGTIEIHAGGGDRGDAAMVASGLTRYLMAHGERALAEELWPAMEWCLEFCRRRTNENGVVASKTDELEGRFPTGDANLSTSALAYDGLRGAANLARDLGRTDEAAEYDRRADDLARAIERHFGATVEGFPTYRYYAGNTTLRSWIALPLCFGLLHRAEGTIAALFSPRLWTPDGLATEAGDKTFWDRATLYALRGVFRAGATETALQYLTAYSRRRLLGDHVPYPVEAYPEGGQAHLSAESALYCRVFTEGLFGIEPTGLRSFRLTPRLPETWKFMDLTLPAFGHKLKIEVRADGSERARVVVKETKSRGSVHLDETGPRGTTYAVTLPQ
jgi:hypothetical protein